MTAIVALLGLAGGAALVVAVANVVGRGSASSSKGRSLAEQVEALHVSASRAAVGLVVGVVVFALTGWPVAGVLGVVAFVYVPALLRGGVTNADVAKVEAVAAWAEMLRDTLGAAGGLQQSITATAPVAPAAIRPELLAVSERLSREPLAPVLRRLADELDDPTADLVISALLLAAERSPRQLAPLLGTLAGQARADVASRLRVEAGRARTRSSVRIITLMTIGFAFGLVVLNPTYVAAYNDLPGQLMLLVVAGLFTGGLVWIGRSSHEDRPERFLTMSEASP